jgi:signal transduction histidine kinase
MFGTGRTLASGWLAAGSPGRPTGREWTGMDRFRRVTVLLLGAPLASLAATSPIPAQVRADLPERPSAAIETMAYFCAAELLANAIKHSSANLIEIIINAERAGLLRLSVIDDGAGGADPSRGSGLEGLAQRVSTVDGVLHVSSPRGGPTTVTVELPMRIYGGAS